MIVRCESILEPPGEDYLEPRPTLDSTWTPTGSLS